MTSSPDRRTAGFVPGLVKGLATTARTLTKPAHTHEYPDAAPELPSRSRGVIALLEENCTSCMLCARECPDWCIYIDSHKETIPATTSGGRDRQRNVLDRFAIDYSLCMYCGICVEVCPFDALFWSPQFEYAETDIRDMLHEKQRLGEWMPTVPPPIPLDPRSADPAELAAADKPARAPRTPRRPREPVADAPSPSASAPTTEQPSVPAPTAEQPSVPAPTTEQPSVPAPTTEQPSVPAPTTEQPSVPAPTAEQPSVPAPTAEQPSVPAPTTEQPSVPAPTAEQPSVPAPTTEQPSVPAPTTEQPSVPAPTAEQPSVPAPTAEQPSVPAPTAEQPTVPASTAEPTTEQPAGSSAEDAAEPPPRRARVTSAELVRRATEVTEAAERDAGDRRPKEGG